MHSRALGLTADGALVWSLLLSCISGVFVVDVQPSATAALNTSYLLVGLALVGKVWVRVTRPNLVACTVLIGMGFAGWLSWAGPLGSSQALIFWQAWILGGALLLFGATFGVTRWERWRYILVGFACLLAAVQALSLLTAREILVEKLAGAGAEEFYSARPIGASAALLIVAGFVICLYLPMDPRWRTVVASLLGISVVVAQHRSVWVALLLSLLLVAGNRRSLPSEPWSWWPPVITGGFFLVSVFGPTVVGVNLLPASRVQNGPGLTLPEAATSASSLEWRLEMWRSRLSAGRSLGEALFGGVFGVTPVKIPGTGVMNPTLSAHSQYVDLITMTGLVGLVLAVGLLLAAVLRLRQINPSVWTFLWTLASYGVFNSWPSWSWLLIGVGLASLHAQALTTTRLDLGQPSLSPS